MHNVTHRRAFVALAWEDEPGFVDGEGGMLRRLEVRSLQMIHGRSTAREQGGSRIRTRLR